MADQYTMPSLKGGVLTLKCPPWCTHPHGPEGLAENVWHEGPALTFMGPPDHYGQEDGQPYEVMSARLSAQPNDADGTYGTPYLYLESDGGALGSRLNVDQADAALADLRLYVDRLQQLRDQLAKITEGEK